MMYGRGEARVLHQFVEGARIAWHLPPRGLTVEAGDRPAELVPDEEQFFLLLPLGRRLPDIPHGRQADAHHRDHEEHQEVGEATDATAGRLRRAASRSKPPDVIGASRSPTAQCFGYCALVFSNCAESVFSVVAGGLERSA